MAELDQSMEASYEHMSAKDREEPNWRARGYLLGIWENKNVSQTERTQSGVKIGLVYETTWGS